MNEDERYTENFPTISDWLMTYTYTQEHHNNYNTCYNNQLMEVVIWSEDEHRKDKDDG